MPDKGLLILDFKSELWFYLTFFSAVIVIMSAYLAWD